MPPTHPKSWILTTSQDYQPGGSLSLGQVLLDPGDPASALISAGTIPIPPETTRDRTEKRIVEIENTNSLKTSFLMWLKLNAPGLAKVGLHADAGATASTQSNWKMDTLKADLFVPSLSYVRQVMGVQEVKDNTRWYQAQRRIFIITGTRIAKGASVGVDEAMSHGVKGGGEVSAQDPNTAVGGSGGVDMERDSSTSQVMRAKSMSNFVFAYRLHEVNYRLWLSPPQPYGDGETSAVGDGEGAKPSGGTKSDSINPTGYEVDSVEEEPFDIESFEPGTYDIPESHFVD